MSQTFRVESSHLVLLECLWKSHGHQFESLKRHRLNVMIWVNLPRVWHPCSAMRRSWRVGNRRHAHAPDRLARPHRMPAHA
eukprot:6337941-Amphidinium_carterae.1